MLVGGLFTGAFFVGQFLVWQHLVGTGFYAEANPANAFFFAITGLHAAHLLGGLVAWVRAGLKLMEGGDPAALRLSVELCASYWHYLLAIWLVLFVMLILT